MEKRHLPNTVIVRECAIRDGFQSKEKFIPTAAKIFLANAIVDAGFRFVDTTDYSTPERVPQFRDRDELFRRMKRDPAVEYVGIAHKLDSAERALEAKLAGHGPDMLEMCIATSEPRNEAYFGLTHDETWRTFERAIKLTADAGMKFQICLITIWSCPFKGRMDPTLAVEFADRAVEMGCTSLCHSDPYGDATPAQTFEYFSTITDRHPDVEHYFHNHDWRGFGIANYVAAMQAGVRRFDTESRRHRGLVFELRGWHPREWCSRAARTPRQDWSSEHRGFRSDVRCHGHRDRYRHQ